MTTRSASPVDSEYFKASWKAGEWAITNQMLADVSGLFEQNNLPYFICYGTFLGAVRHHGVIPWDDDVDLGVVQADESKLKAMKDALNLLGYSIVPWSIPWGDEQMDYYKIWITAQEANSGLPYSWPFIDVFVFRPDRVSGEYFDGQCRIKEADLFPLSRYRLGALELPGPATDQFLVDEYGADFATRCVSSGHDHKLEQARDTTSAPLTMLMESGYCDDVYLNDPYRLDKCPQRAHGIAPCVEQQSFELVSDDGTRFILNHTLLKIWEWSDGNTSLEAMIARVHQRYQIPKIEIALDVIQAITCLEKNKLIHFDPHP